MAAVTWGSPPSPGGAGERDPALCAALGMEQMGPRCSGAPRMGIQEQSVCRYFLHDSASPAENLFASSFCITFVHLWTRCHKVLKLHSV